MRPGRAGGGPRRPTFEWTAPDGTRLCADASVARFDVAGVARFLVEEGARITVEAYPGGDPFALRSLLHGTVVALLLGQRREFALHASTVRAHGRGIAVTGDSGAGKSTTVLALRAAGHELVTDDVSPVSAAGVVTPFGRALHVWPETAAALGVDVSDAEPVCESDAKYSLPVGPAAPVRLDSVVWLRRDPGADEVRYARPDRLEAVNLLLRNAYRFPMLMKLWPSEVFAWAADLAGRVDTAVLTRPAATWSVDRVAALIGDVRATPVG
ncbi:HPr kinase [Virgisporangium aliadipatigenens]|uniref:HPr kinase n=1 Tax=Virgisporangium aliadipatigenens TaxID=741659 RepID=A0A8J3YTT0_9ACTN|nr:HPr kinase [Virgisporangium aliadipatigenens]